MNWEAIGAISETIGAAGVIATLLYLSLQVRASTRASSVESKLVSADAFFAAHFQFRQGAVSESDFFENLITIRYFIYSVGGLQWWEKVGKYMFGPEFVAVIEAEIHVARSA